MPPVAALARHVQRNRLALLEGAGGGTAKERDMAHRAERARDVARQAADVGALGDGGFERGGFERVAGGVISGECGNSVWPGRAEVALGPTLSRRMTKVRTSS